MEKSERRAAQAARELELRSLLVGIARDLSDVKGTVQDIQKRMALNMPGPALLASDLPMFRNVLEQLENERRIVAESERTEQRPDSDAGVATGDAGSDERDEPDTRTTDRASWLASHLWDRWNR